MYIILFLLLHSSVSTLMSRNNRTYELWFNRNIYEILGLNCNKSKSIYTGNVMKLCKSLESSKKCCKCR